MFLAISCKILFILRIIKDNLKKLFLLSLTLKKRIFEQSKSENSIMCEFKIINETDGSQIAEEILVLSYTDDNELIPLFGGIKLTGKAGKFNLGFLNMTAEKTRYINEDELVQIPKTNFSVLFVSINADKTYY